MAGLYIKELILRSGTVVRACLVVSPGGLVEQWHDELAQKFGLQFEMFARRGCRTLAPGCNSVSEHKPFLICAHGSALSRMKSCLKRLGRRSHMGPGGGG